MDLNTIEALIQPSHRDAIPAYTQGDAFLAGGTWLFSEPQTDLKRLVDLMALGWPPITVSETGLDISATCTLAELEGFQPHPSWQAAPLIGQCCNALLGSFKIRHVATVGGNLCLALAASPMAALFAALDGICTIWQRDDGERQIPALDFVTGANANALRPGEVLRSIQVQAVALQRRTAFRKMSLTPDGRSAALLIGVHGADGLALTIAASTPRPVRLLLPHGVGPGALANLLDERVEIWYDDVHGAPRWRRRITHLMAAEICAEFYDA